MTIIERRFLDVEDVEIREEGGSFKFSGYAAVFNSETDIGPFREKIAPGAFRRTIGPGRANVAFLYNHNPDSVMAHTGNGTLRLAEDGRGLRTEAELDPSDWDVQRLIPKLRSGNVSKMSFGFRVVRDSWSDPDDDGRQTRTLEEVALFDVSSVTFPAYSDTNGALRTMAKGALAVAETRGIAANLDDVMDTLRGELPDVQDSPVTETQEPAAEVREETPEVDPPPAETPRPSTSRSHLRKRLEYLETTL